MYNVCLSCCFLSVCVCRWYFALISVSGIFAVTFSVIFAYVADITEEHERSTAYGLVTTATDCGYHLSACYTAGCETEHFHYYRK